MKKGIRVTAYYHTLHISIREYSFSLTIILPYTDKTVDFPYTGQNKSAETAFLHILCSDSFLVAFFYKFVLVVVSCVFRYSCFSNFTLKLEAAYYQQNVQKLNEVNQKKNKIFKSETIQIFIKESTKWVSNRSLFIADNITVCSILLWPNLKKNQEMNLLFLLLMLSK